VRGRRRSKQSGSPVESSIHRHLFYVAYSRSSQVFQTAAALLPLFVLTSLSLSILQVLLQLCSAMGLFSRFKLHTEPNSFASATNGLKSNKDLDPVPFESEERKWTWPSLLGFVCVFQKAFYSRYKSWGLKHLHTCTITLLHGFRFLASPHVYIEIDLLTLIGCHTVDC